MNKFDNILRKDETNNYVIEHSVNNSISTNVKNVSSMPINISDFVNKLNINAKEFVPRNLINSQPKHQR